MTKYDPTSEPLPFASQGFAAAWRCWLEHRKEIKRPLTATAARLQLRRLAKMPEPRAVAVIESSIEHGWVGLYENSAEGNGNAEPARCKPLERQEYSEFKGW